MKAKDFDAAFESGKDVSHLLDDSTAERLNQKTRRVNLDLPEWMIVSLDKEATRIGVSRQAIVKIWLAQNLEQRRAA